MPQNHWIELIFSLPRKVVEILGPGAHAVQGVQAQSVPNAGKALCTIQNDVLE